MKKTKHNPKLLRKGLKILSDLVEDSNSWGKTAYVGSHRTQFVLNFLEQVATLGVEPIVEKPITKLRLMEDEIQFNISQLKLTGEMLISTIPHIKAPGAIFVKDLTPDKVFYITLEERMGPVSIERLKILVQTARKLGITQCQWDKNTPMNYTLANVSILSKCKKEDIKTVGELIKKVQADGLESFLKRGTKLYIKFTDLVKEWKQYPELKELFYIYSK